jgi:hypothetical protein
MCPSPTRQGGVLWWNKRRTPAVPERGKDNSLYTEYNDSSVLGDKHEAGQEAGKDMSNPATSRHRRRLTFITHINHLHTTNQKLQYNPSTMPKRENSPTSDSSNPTPPKKVKAASEPNSPAKNSKISAEIKAEIVDLLFGSCSSETAKVIADRVRRCFEVFRPYMTG